LLGSARRGAIYGALQELVSGREGRDQSRPYINALGCGSAAL